MTKVSISPDSQFRISLARLSVLIILTGSVCFTAGIALARVIIHEQQAGHHGTIEDIQEIKNRLTRIETILESR